MKVTVIIPTYNERENIGPLIEALEEEFEKIPNHEMSILVVDDNSPDGTADVVRSMMKQPDLAMITGQKEGLGAAYNRGIRYAMNEMGAEIIMSMDADFSHNPKDVKRLLAEIDRGADYVVGSRYVPGGSIPAEWGLHRKFLSFFGNFVARLLGVWEVHDQTPAFRAIRVRGVLDKINLEDMPEGYASQIAFVCWASTIGAKFSEVPVHFADREKGESKMPLRSLFEALGFLIKYRIRKASGI